MSLASGIHNAFSQRETYVINKKKDIAYASLSLISWGSFYYFEQQIPGLTPAQIAALNPQSLPSYDRPAINHHSVDARIASNLLIYATFCGKAALFSKEKRKDVIAIGIVGYQSLFLSQAIANGLKLGIKRNRPYTYNPDVSLEEKSDPDARFSFFSGHAATMSSLCFTTAFAYQLYYPNSRYKKIVWASALALPVVEGYLRVRSGKHFPTDVLTGYLVGLGTSYLMHKLHLKKSK